VLVQQTVDGFAVHFRRARSFRDISALALEYFGYVRGLKLLNPPCFFLLER
jgi:hypothetical protein